ncbi:MULTISPECIES: multicopper oxidase family protein [Aminobacter]|jgi:FtsP/CotA-like multicopper oxidase with cupredoxin domain|uniref:FtsP/CotA-like multicopper oxidase with cupredoxin domain n=1 Tax=Aminobacter ciceronei TaxID=150723 RepID=A0ABR6CEC4_9HYPH|nr:MULTISPECIES: multicopper oxidase family protein [Aminobacter]MBA8909133.1 FtsP/CotA-like multicopper oxidase with cupredoxin domain [Aminobacter ciceronei]MBA9022905.1 FtsP/CotA-like multicopper oxidase with cupredoxin domain [Aminobacter ciceronei]QOF70829.1 multicopper oxidase family protein [Aminobacter sp. SR38]
MPGISRREVLLGGAAALAAAATGAVAASRANAVDLTLRASMLRHSILPGTTTEGMMSFHADGPPPVLRLPQGKPFSIDVVNELEEATIVHWHGLRIANAMDGVPYLTQAPIAPGNSFRYTLAAPDAGTYWYHPHCNTLEQMARGLTGVLVVEDEEDPGFDRDLPLNIRDFRLGSDGQFIELFKPRNAARGGTLGTVGTVNWEVAPTYDLAAGSLVRLRLAVTDVTRVGTYDLEGGTALVIALDANPLAQPIAPKGIVMAPGQRADIALRVPDSAGDIVSLSLRTPQGPRLLARFRPLGASIRRRLDELKPLRPNPIPQADLANAETIDFIFGWSPGGDAPAPSICGTLGYTFWSINRVAGQSDIPGPGEPLAVLKQGRSYVLRLRNETPNDHPIHLHGMSFRLLRSDKRKVAPLVTDTALLLSKETMEVALVADNPGDWAFHCHVIEHQRTGLSGYLRVEA